MPTVIHQLADAFLKRKEAAQRKSVFPEDSFMPKSSKQDLANRLSVFEQGGTTELLKQAGKEMYENPVVNTAISLTPGAGDIQSGYEAYRSAREGNYGEAGLNALGVLPFVPALGGVVKKTNQIPDLWYHGTQKDFPEFKGTTFVTKNPNVASKFAADDMLWSPESSYITEGANIRPVSVDVKNPFDYENAKHVNSVAKILDPRDKKEFKNAAAQGNWQKIEDFLDSIKDAGYDSFFVNEFGAKNLGVFEPKKSIKGIFEK